MSIYKGSTKLDTIAKGSSNLSGIYLGNDKIRPTGWQPGADTLLYYDFEHTDVQNKIETNLANTGTYYKGVYQTTPTFFTLASGKKYFGSLGRNALNTDNTLSNLNYNNCTVCLRFKRDENNKPYFGQERWSVKGGTIFCEHYQTTVTFCVGDADNGGPININQSNCPLSTRCNVVIINSGKTSTLYINSSQKGTATLPNNCTGNKYFHLGGAAVYNSQQSPKTLDSSRLGQSSFGSVIIENRARTIQEKDDYFSQTKSLYGVS